MRGYELVITWDVFLYSPRQGNKSPIRHYRQCRELRALQFYDEEKGQWRESANDFFFPRRNPNCRIVAQNVRFK